MDFDFFCLKNLLEQQLCQICWPLAYKFSFGMTTMLQVNVNLGSAAFPLHPASQVQGLVKALESTNPILIKKHYFKGR